MDYVTLWRLWEKSPGEQNVLEDKRRIYTQTGEELFTGDEVADLLGVGAGAVRTWMVRHGKNRAFPKLGGINLFTNDDIEFFRTCRKNVGRPPGEPVGRAVKQNRRRSFSEG